MVNPGQKSANNPAMIPTAPSVNGSHLRVLWSEDLRAGTNVIAPSTTAYRPNRRASTARARPGQKRTTRPNSRATRPRSARTRQLGQACSTFACIVLRCPRLCPPLVCSLLFSSTCSGVRKGVVDRSVELGTQQDNRTAQVEVEEQTYGGAN